MRKAPIRHLNALRRRNIHTHDLTAKDSLVKITTLPNKIRVATENTPGHFAALGLYVDAGSRYETTATSGVSHFLDRMAFKVRSLYMLYMYNIQNLSNACAGDHHTVRCRHGSSNGQAWRSNPLLVHSGSDNVSVIAFRNRYTIGVVTHS